MPEQMHGVKRYAVPESGIVGASTSDGACLGIASEYLQDNRAVCTQDLGAGLNVHWKLLVAAEIHMTLSRRRVRELDRLRAEWVAPHCDGFVVSFESVVCGDGDFFASSQLDRLVRVL